MPTLDSFRTFVARTGHTGQSWKRSISALHMPERFSQDARMVSFVAHEHAFRLGHNCVGTDHLVLALLDDHRALALLQNAGVNVDAVRRIIGQRMASEAE